MPGTWVKKKATLLPSTPLVNVIICHHLCPFFPISLETVLHNLMGFQWLQESETWCQKGVADYLLLSEQHLEKEKGRCSEYMLDPSTLQLLGRRWEDGGVNQFFLFFFFLSQKRIHFKLNCWTGGLSATCCICRHGSQGPPCPEAPVGGVATRNLGQARRKTPDDGIRRTGAWSAGIFVGSYCLE